MHTLIYLFYTIRSFVHKRPISAKEYRLISRYTTRLNACIRMIWYDDRLFSLWKLFVNLCHTRKRETELILFIFLSWTKAHSQSIHFHSCQNLFNTYLNDLQIYNNFLVIHLILAKFFWYYIFSEKKQTYSPGFIYLFSSNVICCLYFTDSGISYPSKLRKCIKYEYH